MNQPYHYYLCDATVQPIPIQKALLTSLSSTSVESDEQVKTDLQKVLQELKWTSILVIVADKAVKNQHWETLNLAVNKTLTNLDEINEITGGSVIIYELQTDIPFESQAGENGDIVWTLINDSNTPAITVRQKLAETPRTSLWSRLKKIISPKRHDKTHSETSNQKVIPASTPKNDAKFGKILSDNELSDDEGSEYENASRFFTPDRRVGFEPNPPSIRRKNDRQSYLLHNSSCNTTRCCEKKKIGMRMSAQIEIPIFDQDETIIDMVIEKLRFIHEQLGVESEQIIFAFCSKNNLSDTHLSLNNAQKSSIDEFAEVLRERFGTSEASAANKFGAIQMRSNEDESDLMARIKHIFNLMKRKEINSPVDKGDEYFLKEKFISSLTDPSVRLLLRQTNVNFKDLVKTARDLRQAKDTESKMTEKASERSLLIALSKRVDELELGPTVCDHCGRNHLNSQCRENEKGKAQYRKQKNGSNKPKAYVHFNESGQRENPTNKKKADSKPQPNQNNQTQPNNYQNYNMVPQNQFHGFGMPGQFFQPNYGFPHPGNFQHFYPHAHRANFQNPRYQNYNRPRNYQNYPNQPAFFFNDESNYMNDFIHPDENVNQP